jgi:hypothetical protein
MKPSELILTFMLASLVFVGLLVKLLTKILSLIVQGLTSITQTIFSMVTETEQNTKEELLWERPERLTHISEENNLEP